MNPVRVLDSDSLSKFELERYSRHILLNGIGLAGQKRLKKSSVLIIGLGGLGSPVALYLAAAGVGQLTILDSDQLELSNLGRQIIHTTQAVGQPKVDSARRALEALNPECSYVFHSERFAPNNAADFVAGVDLIIEGSDNFPTKFLANDAAILGNTPAIIGGILRFDGSLLTLMPRQSACYRCLFTAPPPAGAVPSCADAGVVGAMAGVVGSFMALEAVKFLARDDYPLGAYQEWNGWEGTSRRLVKKQNPNCPVCGAQATINDLQDLHYKDHA